MNRRLWFDWHSWAGLKLSMFMAFILATGTLAVLAHEIDWVLHPEMRVTPRRAPTASWGAWSEAVWRAHPEATLIRLDAPIDPWFAVRGTLRMSDGTSRYVWIEPWQAKVLGDTSFVNAHRILRNTHRHLMLPVQIGVPIVCSLTVLLGVSLVTSLVVYKRWWRGFLQRPRRQPARRRWGDWHRLLGLWALWFVLLMVLTGVWYAVEQLGGSAPAAQRFGKLHQAPEGQLAPRYAASQVDRAVAAGLAAFPGLALRAISLPQAASDPLLLEGQAGALLVRQRANSVAVEVDGAGVIGLARGEQLSLHQRVAEAADPLHFGTWGGLASKLVWFLFGAALTTLALIGTWLYVLRLRVAQRELAAPAGALLWQGMGRWRWVSLCLILVSLALTPRLFLL
jgi:uncharacterized iron-regulated membrane protein